MGTLRLITAPRWSKLSSPSITSSANGTAQTSSTVESHLFQEGCCVKRDPSGYDQKNLITRIWKTMYKNIKFIINSPSYESVILQNNNHE